MIKITCDRCGREIEPEIGYIGHVSMRYREEPDGELMGEDPFARWDLCQECMGEIERFIRRKGYEGHIIPELVLEHAPEREREEAPEPGTEQEPVAEQQQEPEPQQEPEQEQQEPEHKPHKHKRLDYGKIAALMAAGWNAKDIAVEMGLSLPAVRTAMFRAREKGLLPGMEAGT